MYISNSAAFNMRIKVTIFTRPLKGSTETEVSFSPHSPCLKSSILYKVGCVFPMVVVSILPHADFGRNEHRERKYSIVYKTGILV